jgi:hypothetical protein
VSAGPGAEGARPGPAPRSLTLTRLETELRHARDVCADAYAAQIEAEIARLSQGSASDPARETTSASRRPAATARRKR